MMNYLRKYCNVLDVKREALADVNRDAYMMLQSAVVAYSKEVHQSEITPAQFDDIYWWFLNHDPALPPKEWKVAKKENNHQSSEATESVHGGVIMGKTTNHDKFYEVFHNKGGQEFTTVEIKQLMREAGVTEGSILPNDHGAGNNSSCRCCKTNARIFDHMGHGNYRVRENIIPIDQI